jgi:ribonuclease D
VTAARAKIERPADLATLPVFSGPRQRRLSSYWFAALTAARDLPEQDLPPISQMPADPDAMPAPSRWREKDPTAAIRLAACKEVVAEAARHHQVVAQNLLAGDVVRRLAWRVPEALTEIQVRDRLSELGARRWQIDLLAADLTKALDMGV